MEPHWNQGLQSWKRFHSELWPARSGRYRALLARFNELRQKLRKQEDE